MKREFTINIILILAINLLIKPAFIFGVDMRVQDLVGLEAYGEYFSYFNFVFLFQVINDPGIQNWSAQFVPKNRLMIQDHLSQVLWLKWMLLPVFLLVVFVISMIFGYDKTELIILVAINLFFGNLFLVLRNHIAGMGFYRMDSFLSAMDKVLMLILLVYLTWFSPFQAQFTIQFFLLGQMFSLVLACCLAFVLLKQKISFHMQRIKKQRLLEILKLSAPFIITALLMTIYNKVDGILLAKLLNDDHYQAGVYATAFRFYDAANMTSYLFAALLLPMFAANIHQIKMLEALTDIGSRFVFFCALLIGTVLFHQGDELFGLVLKHYDADSIVALKILTLSFMVMSVSYIFGSLMVALDKVSKLNFLFGLAIGINVGFNVLLIPTYGAIGAAIVALITQVFIVIGQCIIIKKEADISLPWSFVYKSSFSLILIHGAMVIIKIYVHLHWMMEVLLGGLICLVLAIGLKIIDLRELKEFLKERKT